MYVSYLVMFPLERHFPSGCPTSKKFIPIPPLPPPQGKICSLPLSFSLSPPAVVVFINTSESCYCIEEEGKYRREEKGKYPVVIVSVVFVNGWKVYGSCKMLLRSNEVSISTNHRIKRWQNRKVRFLIRLHLKVALPRHIEESSSRWEGRVSRRRQIV